MNKYFKRQKPSLNHLSINQEAFTALRKDLKLFNNPVIVDIIECLFEGSEAQKADRRSIINPDKFYLYFDNNLSSEGLLFREFIPLLERDFSVIKKQIYEWMDEGKISSIIEILKTVDAFYTLERFHKVSKTWVLILNRETQRDLLIEDWISNISSHMDRIEQMFGVERSFFKTIHEENNESFFFDTYVIRNILRKFINREQFTWPIGKGELQKISIERLRQFVSTTQEFDIRAFGYFYHNCWKEKQNEHVIILEEANEIIAEYISIYPDDFLRYTIRAKFGPHIDGSYVFEPFTPQYFGSWDNFEKFLKNRAEENNEFTSMLKFYEDFKRNSFDSFYTSDIPIWIELDSNQNPEFKYFKHQTREAFIQEYENKIR